jgi:seryl-tRNA synthetase
MLDIKAIRNHPEQYKRDLQRKFVDPAIVDLVLKLDQQKRALLQKIESLKQQQNEASKTINQHTGEKKQKILADMKDIAEERKKEEKELENVRQVLQKNMDTLPNPPRAEVKTGKDDSENEVARTVGEKPKFDFEPKEHWELAETLNLLDTEQASHVSGSRFYYLKNELALLQQALMMWAFRKVADKGFTPVIPPFMTRDRALYGTGYLDKDENYRVNPETDDLYLIGTSEVPMVSMHADQILDLDQGPLLYAAYSPCFRREAGSYGKDTKGILRVHQFEKIEMIAFTKPEEAVKIHEMIREIEEEILQDLGLPYQVINICTGDLGCSASKKYDLEAWLPGQNQYREMTSTSICDDYQTRRLNIRYRDTDGKLAFACALNGTAVSSRPLIAIMENFQQKNGDILIPEVLVPYCGFAKIEKK